MPKSRDRGIDLIKAAAIFAVLVIHSCAYTDPVGSARWCSAVVLGSLVRPAVPLFLMCSGALMLPPERELTAKRLWLRHFPRLLASMLVWAMVYKVYRLLTLGALSVPALWQAAKEVLCFQQEFHFYYLQIMLLVYAALPVTRVFVRAANRRQVEYALLLWFAAGILWPTVRTYWPFTLMSGYGRYYMNMTYASIGYGLLGWYLTAYPPKKWLAWTALLAGFALTLGGTLLRSLRAGALDEHWWEGMTLGVMVYSAGAFCLLHSAGSRLRRGKAVELLSSGSFCVYLVHVLFLYIFRDHGFTGASFFPLAAVPLLALALLACSLAVYAVLRKIPVVNRWLI